MLEEKLHNTYMLAAMWNKEKWLNVDSNIGEHRTSTREKQCGNHETHSHSDQETNQTWEIKTELAENLNKRG